MAEAPAGWLADALGERGGWLPPAALRRLRAERGADPAAWSAELLAQAAARSHAPVSDFAASAFAVVATADGDALALGANLEFHGAGLGAAVHAEQAALNLARRHGARRLLALALSAPPCGHCRQFLLEAEGAAAARILLPGAAESRLAELMPMPFAPAALGVAPGLFGGARVALRLRDDSSDALVRDAFDAARTAYAPYSRAPAGAALLDAAGRVHLGATIESVAYNPTLAALAAALSGAALARAPGESFPILRRAVLVEALGAASQRLAAEALLGAAAPGVPLEYHAAERTD